MPTVKRTDLFICLVLALAVAALYAPEVRYPFINYDDRQYLLENTHVTAGLTLHNLRWAFTVFYQANWHPLTWLSHMLDVELFGLDPAGHHLTSVLLHGANTLLLYVFLFRIAHYTIALSLQPDYGDARGNMGVALLRQGNLEEAVRQFAIGVHVVLGSDDLKRFALGLEMVREGRYNDATAQFDAAVRSDPGHAVDYARLGSMLIRFGRGQR